MFANPHSFSRGLYALGAVLLAACSGAASPAAPARPTPEPKEATTSSPIARSPPPSTLAEWRSELPAGSILRDGRIDREGDIFLAPTMSEAASVAGHALPQGLTLLSIKEGGQLRWHKHLSSSRETFVRTIALRDDGDFIIAGTFVGTLRFDGLEVRSQGDRDAFVALIGKDGGGRWLRSLGGIAREQASSAAISEDGTLISIGGWAESSFHFGGKSYPARGTAKDGFVATFSASGAPRWAARYRGVGVDEVHSVAYEQKSLVVLGSFSTDLRIDGHSIKTQGERDIFALRYAAGGALEWMRAWGSNKSDHGVALHQSDDASLLIIAQSGGDLQLGDVTLPALGKSDLVLWALNASGNAQDAKRYGGKGRFFALAAEGDETLRLSGYYQGAGVLSHLRLPESLEERAMRLEIGEGPTLLTASPLDAQRLLFTRRRFGMQLDVTISPSGRVVAQLQSALD